MTGSRLLQLPKELRLDILEHLFEDDQPIIIGQPSRVPWQGKPARYHPPVSETCVTLRHEALPAFYHSCPIVLLLRYREGRRQVQHWIDQIMSDARIASALTDVSIRLFEDTPDSTLFHVDIRKLQILNTNSWLHPLTCERLHPLETMEQLLSDARLAQQESGLAQDIPQILHAAIGAMLTPLEHSRLMQCESMANSRLQGYTDYQLRFEVVSTMQKRV